MPQFHQLPDSSVVLSDAGVMYDTTLWYWSARNNILLAKHTSGGFVELRRNNATSSPGVIWREMQVAEQFFLTLSADTYLVSGPDLVQSNQGT